MKVFILKIVGAALLCSFSEHLVPEGWQKYMKLISGLIIISVLISPFTEKNSLKLFDGFNPDSTYTDRGEEILFDEIKKELKKRVEDDIHLRVSEEFSEDVTAKVTIKTTPDGKIEKVQKIVLTGSENDNISERLKFVYGTEEVIWIE